jgi:hypothetical protein
MQQLHPIPNEHVMQYAPDWLFKRLIDYNQEQRRQAYLWALHNLDGEALREVVAFLRYRLFSLHRQEQAMYRTMRDKLTRFDMRMRHTSLQNNSTSSRNTAPPVCDCNQSGNLAGLCLACGIAGEPTMTVGLGGDDGDDGYMHLPVPDDDNCPPGWHKDTETDGEWGCWKKVGSPQATPPQQQPWYSDKTAWQGIIGLANAATKGVKDAICASNPNGCGPNADQQAVASAFTSFCQQRPYIAECQQAFQRGVMKPPVVPTTSVPAGYNPNQITYKQPAGKSSTQSPSGMSKDQSNLLLVGGGLFLAYMLMQQSKTDK